MQKNNFIDYKSYEGDPKKDRQFMRNNILIRILRNMPLHDTLKNLCSEYGFDLMYNCKITVAALENSNIGDYLDSLDAQRALNYVSNIKTGIHNTIVKHFSIFRAFYIADAEKHSYLVIVNNLDKDDNVIADEIKQCVKNFQSNFSNQFSLYMSFAISGTVCSIDNLHRAYKEAEDARIFIEMLGSDNEVVFYDSIRARKDNLSVVSVDAYTEVRDMIRGKEYTAASTNLIKIINADIAVLNPKQLRCKMYALIEALIRELTEVTQFYDINFLQRLNFSERLLDATSAEILKKTVKDIFSSLENYVEQNAGYNAEWVQKVKNYINANYSDMNLNVSFLADKFRFNLSYFSRVFKKETGKGVYDYIQEKRVEASKEMLKSKMSINEIAVKVGYLDGRTFIKAFKKITGDTPLSYKHK